MTSAVKYGLIGLGNVGTDLVKGAVKAGLDLTVFDIDDPALARAAELGATPATSAAQVATTAHVLVLSLPNSDIVQSVLADGVLDALSAGDYLVDMSTNRPAAAVELAAEGQRRGLHVLEAPVSYGPQGLVSFVGGDATDAVAIAPWLDATTVHHGYVGPHGHGQYVKLVQNMLSGVGMGIVAEILGFAQHAGVDVEAMHEQLKFTGGYSRMVEGCLNAMTQGRYGNAGTMALHRKDMGYAIEAAEQMGAHVPFTSALHEAFGDVLRTGDPRWGQTALIERFTPAPEQADR